MTDRETLYYNKSITYPTFANIKYQIRMKIGLVITQFVSVSHWLIQRNFSEIGNLNDMIKVKYFSVIWFITCRYVVPIFIYLELYRPQYHCYEFATRWALHQFQKLIRFTLLQICIASAQIRLHLGTMKL